MKIIGITGRMGSGKTTIGEYLTSWMNIPVFDCDSAAKTAYEDPLIIEILKHVYGYNVVTKSIVNKKALADIIFSNSNEMKFIKRLTDPFVYREYEKFISKCSDFKLRVFAIESATLLNSQFYDKCDHILVKTTENDNINIERCVKRSHIYISNSEIQSRLNLQMSNSEMLEFNKTIEIKDDVLPEDVYNIVFNLL